MIINETVNSVAVLRMEHGKVQAIDVELLDQMSAELTRVETSPEITAVVITGAGKAFSAGVDLFRLLNGGHAYAKEFLSGFHRALKHLFLFRKPVVAAVNGHAIAGGCVLTCACDYRIVADGPATTGLTEMLVGVPFPALALEIVRFAAAPQHLQEILYTGKTFPVDEAVKRGLLDRVVPPDILLKEAQEQAARLGAIPSESFRLVKHQLRQPAVDRAESWKSADEVQRIWESPDIHLVIREYLNKTIGKKTK